MDRRPVGSARIIRGNALALPLADESVDLVVTSPPYFGLRSYQDTCAACRDLQRTGDNPREAFPDWSEHQRKFHHYGGQIGSEATPAEFVDALVAATREMVRVLKPTGSIWVNLGDRYSTGSSGDRNNGFNERSGNAPGKRAQERSQVKVASAEGFRPKTLIGVPWRYALRCIDDLGLILRAEVIWSKPNGLPESVTDRVRRSHETWFHFTRSPRYYSAVDEIREEYGPASVAHARKYAGKYDTEYGAGNHGTGGSTLRFSEQNALGKLPGSVWTIPTQPLKVPASLGIDHFAAFPMEWPRRIIQGWSPAGVCTACGEGRRPVVEATGQYVPANGQRALGGDGERYAAWTGGDKRQPIRTATGWSLPKAEKALTGYACACPDATAPSRPAVVLDPFGGTGTTALVAKVLGRDGVHVDMSADYCRLATWRTNDPGEIARAMQVEKPPVVPAGQMSMFDLMEEETAS